MWNEPIPEDATKVSDEQMEVNNQRDDVNQ